MYTYAHINNIIRKTRGTDRRVPRVGPSSPESKGGSGRNAYAREDWPPKGREGPGCGRAQSVRHLKRQRRGSGAAGGGRGDTTSAGDGFSSTVGQATAWS